MRSVFLFKIKNNIIKLPESILRKPETKNGGMVSTPIRMPKNVVPQKKPTQKIERYSLVFKNYVLAVGCFDFNAVVSCKITQRLP